MRRRADNNRLIVYSCIQDILSVRKKATFFHESRPGREETPSCKYIFSYILWDHSFQLTVQLLIATIQCTNLLTKLKFFFKQNTKLEL